MPTPPPSTPSTQPFPSSKTHLFHKPFLSNPIHHQAHSTGRRCPHQCLKRFRLISAWIWIHLIRVRVVGVVTTIKKLGRLRKVGERLKIVLRKFSPLHLFLS